MIQRRADGKVQPGIRWGPFTLRIPFYHFGFEWPETLQGLIVSGATGLSMIPIMTGYLGIDPDVELAIVVVQSVLIGLAPIVFGDPYCHGWVTPAIPLVLFFVSEMGGGPDISGAEQLKIIQTITAFTLLNAAIFFFAGITGLGRLIVEKIPTALKAGIIFGAAVSAFAHEFRVERFEMSRFEASATTLMNDKDIGTEDFQPPRSFLLSAPYSSLTAVAICMLLMFSKPLEGLKKSYRWVTILAGLGLAPGFLIGMIVAYYTHEAEWEMQWGIAAPPFGEMWRQLSPLSIGWPTWEMYVSVAPLCLVVYIIGFGDIVTGNELLRDAARYRPDEKLDINATRTHLNIGIRNALQALIAGPFPVTHGPLWTGVHVVVTERYKQGRGAMDSIYGGIAAYYFWGIPVLLFLLPVTSFLQPMLPVALSMTILLTGFACSYIAMAIPRNNAERGVAMSIGMVLAFFGPTEALALGLLMTLFMSGWTTESTPREEAEAEGFPS